MQYRKNLINKSNISRLAKFLPFILAVGVLLFIGWTVFEAIDYPYDGILYIYPTGLIKEIDPTGPAQGHLLPGDTVRSVNGIPWKFFSGYIGNRGGDPIVFTIERQGVFKEISYILENQSPNDTFRTLGPIIIALFFWATGLIVQSFITRDRETVLFFAWCQASALALTAGTASYLGPAWASKLFGCMLWLIGPLSVHFHLQFPNIRANRISKGLMALLYGITLGGIAPYLLFSLVDHRQFSWYALHVSAGRMFLGINLLLVVAIMVINYVRSDTPGARSKIRLVALGVFLAAAPFVLLTLIPDVLFQNPIITYNSAFIWLGILPMTYGYAIFRLQLIEIESHINRAAAFILVYTILGGFYFILYAALERFLPATIVSAPLINTLLTLVLASIFFPVSGQIKKLVDRAFYGGWYDYRSGLLKITQGLEEIDDIDALAKTVSGRLVETFRLEEACVFFRGASGKFSVIQTCTREQSPLKDMPPYPVLPRSSLTYLLKIGLIEREKLKSILSEVSLTPEEHQLLNSEQINLWVPVIGHGEIHGLLALGPKIGGDILSGEDLDILRSIVLQLGPLIENIMLMTRLKKHAEDLENRVNERTAELHNAKERVEAILGSVGDGVIVIDLEGIIQNINPAFEEQSGFSSNEVIGRRLDEFIGLETNQTLLDEISAAIQKGDIWSGELVNRRKDGTYYDIHLTVAPVRDQDKNLVNYVGSQRDITQWKELDRMKDAFIEDVSHELRTPTTNIKLYLDLLSDAPADKRKGFEKVVNEQSQLLIKMVEDILDLSRLAREKKDEFRLGKINLNFLTEQALTAHRPMASASGVELVFEPCEDIPIIHGDQIKISRMITNLVSNAVRYTPQGSITVRTYASDQYSVLEVQDTGLGIGLNDMPHIFDRFYRGANVRQTKIHGTGLGLAIVKEIVTMHAGEIEVDSALGQGSTFTVRIPKSAPTN